MDQTFKSPRDVESILGLPFLGSIPKKAKVTTYHTLADQIYLLLKDKKIKTLLMCSTLSGEGTTTTIGHLGTYLAKNARHNVLIIDANLRNPGLGKFFKAPETHGLTDVLEGKLAFDRAAVDVSENLHLIPAGKTQLNPITLLESHTMQEVIRWSKERYEIVIIDGPSLKEWRDSFAMASYTDAMSLVVNEGVTRHQVVKTAIAPLEAKNTNIIGVILNNRTYSIPKAIYDRV